MASISEKLVTVAENTPKVHHAGQLNVVQSAQSLKGSESNTAMLLDDVSPVTHEMGVRVRGKNLIPFPYRDLKLGTSTYNGVDFTVYEDGSILINGTATSNTTRYLYNNVTDLLGLKSGVAISVNKNVSDNTQQANVYFICNYYDSAAKMQTGIQASTFASGTKTITDDWKGLGIYLHIPSGKTLNNLLIKPQLEIGTTPTAYTPYVPDLMAVKVSRYGKNLWDKDYANIMSNWTSVAGGYAYINIRVPQGKKISVSHQKTLPTDVSINMYVLNGSTQVWMHTKNTNINKVTFTASTNRIRITVAPTPAAGQQYLNRFMDNIGNDLQIEIGSTATDYEEYITPTDYTPTADGTVNGVTSLYPNTTLMTDTDGVIIDCEYYKDIDKAYNKLSAAIALSGGE